VAERVRPHWADGHGQSWALLSAHHVRLKELLEEGLTVVKAGDLLAREGVVVPERTLHRYALRFWAMAGAARRRRCGSAVDRGEDQGMHHTAAPGLRVVKQAHLPEVDLAFGARPQSAGSAGIGRGHGEAQVVVAAKLLQRACRDWLAGRCGVASVAGRGGGATRRGRTCPGGAPADGGRIGAAGNSGPGGCPVHATRIRLAMPGRAFRRWSRTAARVAG
jgi:hypothetical protein